MIRPFTALCMVAAGASGLFLYQSKHQAVMLDRQIMSVLKQTEATRERIGVMRAEWALLNEPERLAELSAKHLGLRTLAPTQFASLADVGSRLPAPVAPGTLVVPSDDVAASAPPAAPPVPAPAAAPAAPVPNARIAARAMPVAPAGTPVAAVAVQAPAAPVRPQRPSRAEPRDDAPAARTAQAATPARTVAPVVTVAAAPIRAPASVPGIGEAVAAHAAAARSVQQAGWRAPPGAPALAAQPAAMAGGYAPGFPGMQQAGGQQAMAQPMAAQSALGGARTALPPPVPYGAQPR